MCLMSSCNGIDIWLEIESPIDPKGSIWTTLATFGLDQLAAAINSP
ncbi:hypothetical protein T06_11071 [Trichinella sp. T6]|nr:hypothetical protein T06_11071 [Trichinella sp. T6]